MVCSHELCGSHLHDRNLAKSRPSQSWPEFDSNFDMWIPCYMGCCGVTGTPTCCGDCSSVNKCLTCFGTCKLGPPSLENWCYLLLNCYLVLLQCRCRPRIADNPICACCGWRYRKVS